MYGLPLQQDGCTECEDGYIPYFYYDYSIECYECGYYECTPCENVFGSGCETCNYYDYCTSCSSGYFSYYGYCYPCYIDHCSECSVYSPCTECWPILGCTECDAGYHIDESGGCTECSTTFTGCNECTSTECTECAEGYFIDGSGGCAECSTIFTGCNECTATECTACDDGYYLNGGSCTRCTSKFPNCAECTSSACTLCKNTHELVGGLCKKLFSQPKLKARWSIYKTGCIKWDISVPLETTADLTLEYGESFNKSILLKSALAMKTAGSWSWTPHGIYKSVGRLKATFSDDHVVYSEEFYIENPTSNYFLPC